MCRYIVQICHTEDIMCKTANELSGTHSTKKTCITKRLLFNDIGTGREVDHSKCLKNTSWKKAVYPDEFFKLALKKKKEDMVGSGCNLGKIDIYLYFLV